MKKIIKIDGKDYTMKASALTQFSYKNETGRSLLKDLQFMMKMDLNKLNNDEEDFDLELIDKITGPLLKMSYVMIQEADDKQAENYEKFLGSIENLYDSMDWILEVFTLACSPLSRQLQIDKQQ